MSHTGDMPWDKADEEIEELYQKLFPRPRRRFTFTEVKRKYTYPKKEKEKPQDTALYASLRR